MHNPFAVTRNGKPLEQLRKDFGDDIWKESSRLSELRTAKEWGLTPDQWFKEPTWSREVMMAVDKVYNEIEAANNFQTKLKHNKKG